MSNDCPEGLITQVLLKGKGWKGVLSARKGS